MVSGVEAFSVSRKRVLPRKQLLNVETITAAINCLNEQIITNIKNSSTDIRFICRKTPYVQKDMCIKGM
jgi:hypothetical protein